MGNNKHISIDRLNEHLFDVIERLKTNNDPEADVKEGISIEEAKTITECAKIVVEGYKVKAQVLSIISKSDNPKQSLKDSIETGLIQLAEAE